MWSVTLYEEVRLKGFNFVCFIKIILGSCDVLFIIQDAIS